MNADSKSSNAPPGASLAPDYIQFLRDATSALRTDVRGTGAAHASAVLDLLADRLNPRADLNTLAAVGLVLQVLGSTMVVEALRS